MGPSNGNVAEDMCRLFALSADSPVTARFWLLDAPHSLRDQSHYNADGTGIGWIDEDGSASVAKRPIAAYASDRFARAATSLTARTMIAHIRLSSGTSPERENTHPFLMNGIIVAHNGVLEVTDELKQRVRALGTEHLIKGTTDSEWMAALIAGEVARRESSQGPRRLIHETAAPGELDAEVELRNEALHDGLVAALSWIARHVPVYSVNLVAARDHHLYAVRLPATNELWVLDRVAGQGAHQALEHRSDTMRAHSDDLREVHSVVIASEPMDDEEGWRLLDPGELVHVNPDGHITSEAPFGPLAHPLRIEDLGLSAAASQAHAAAAKERSERRAAHQDERERQAA